MDHKGHIHGFTIIELIVTLLLVGILAAVALPRMFDATAFKTRRFYEEVVSAARCGQKLAVASGCPVQLSISGGGFALNQLQNCNDSSSGFSRPVPRPAGSGAFAAAAPSGVNLSTTDAAVVFDSLGRATPVGVTVTVDGRSFTIHGESGYVDGP